jgi:hypothetical protein
MIEVVTYRLKEIRKEFRKYERRGRKKRRRN